MKINISAIVLSLTLISLITSCSKESTALEIESEDLLQEEQNRGSACTAFDTSTALYPQLFIIDVTTDISSVISSIDRTEGVTLYFKEGVHNIDGVATGTSELFFDDYPNGIEIVGDGIDCTVIKLNSTGGFNSVKLLKITNSLDIYIHDLAFNGNRDSNLSFPNEQFNNIHMRYIDGVLVDNILSTDAHGDGLNIACAGNVSIVNSRFDETSRNGITLGGNGSDPTACYIYYLTIDGNKFGDEIDTQQIDFEHGDFYAEIQITNNFFEYQNPANDFANQYALVMLYANTGGGSGSAYAEIHGNTFNSNAVLFRRSSKINFYNNHSVGQTMIDRDSHKIHVYDNDFDIIPTGRSTNPVTDAGILIRGVNNAAGVNEGVSEIFVTNNEIKAHSGVPEVIHIEDAEIIGDNYPEVEVVENAIKGSGGFSSIGIKVRAIDASFWVVLDKNTFTDVSDLLFTFEAFGKTITCDGSDCSL